MPVSHSSERLIEVPHIVEKVVERIILMPQVHEVSKHIYNIEEQANPGVVVDVDFQQHETQYKQLYGSLKKDMDSLVIDLRSMKKAHPEMADRLNSVESYMTNLDQVVAHPKIIQVNKEKIVEKLVPAPVLIHSGGKASSKDEAFYLVLIEKYERELKEAQKTNNYAVQDEDLKRLFFSGGSRDEDLRIKDKISQYKQSEEGAKLYNKSDNALISSILHDKYQSISQAERASQESARYHTLADERLAMLHQFKQTNDVLHVKLLELEEKVRQLSRNQGGNKESADALKKLLKEIEELDQVVYSDIKKTKIPQATQIISPGAELSSKLQETKMRELEAQVEALRSKLIAKEGKREYSDASDKDRVIENLQVQISRLVEHKGESMNTLPGSMERLESARLSPVREAESRKEYFAPPTSAMQISKPSETGLSQGLVWDPYGPPAATAGQGVPQESLALSLPSGSPTA